jgi:glycosyltransferase involved in cell wall biosynthesis
MHDARTIDVIVPTYNRSSLLVRAVSSLLEARRPPGLRISVIVVDNRSTDDTRAAVARLAASADLPVHYVFEEKAGSSAARNAGIRFSTAELVGFIDDDERVDAGWFEVIAHAFRDSGLDFIGGPYLGDWEVPPPPWLPNGFPAVLGIVGDRIESVCEFGPGFDGILMGGNAVIRRRIIDEVGLFAIDLGRGPTGLGSGEDEEMFVRLLNRGARGVFLPSLRIYHMIPAHRVQQSYFREWCLHHGRSAGLMERTTPEQVPHILGVPRYRIRHVLEQLMFLAAVTLTGKGKTPRALAAELHVLDFVGFLHGRFLHSNPRGLSRFPQVIPFRSE